MSDIGGDREPVVTVSGGFGSVRYRFDAWIGGQVAMRKGMRAGAGSISAPAFVVIAAVFTD